MEFGNESRQSGRRGGRGHAGRIGCGGGVLISVSDTEAVGAWPGCEGTGTQDDPYRGTFVIDNSDFSTTKAEDAFSILNESYVAVGTEFSIVGTPSRTPSGTYVPTGGFGLTGSPYGIEGTVSEEGIVGIALNAIGDRTFVAQFHVIEYRGFSELEFLSDPVTDGVISYVGRSTV